MDHAGSVTIHRVPRSILTAMILAVLTFAAHLFGVSETLAGADLALYIDRVLDGVVVVATFFGWSQLASAVKDPTTSVMD